VKLMGPPPKIALLDLSMPPGRGSSRGGSRIGCRSTSWSVCTLLSGDSGDVGSRPPKGGVPPFDMAGAGLAPLLLLSPLLCAAAPPAVAAVARCRSHRAARGSAAAEDYAATRPRGAGVACRDRNASVTGFAGQALHGGMAVGCSPIDSTCAATSRAQFYQTPQWSDVCASTGLNSTGSTDSPGGWPQVHYGTSSTKLRPAVWIRPCRRPLWSAALTRIVTFGPDIGVHGKSTHAPGVDQDQRTRLLPMAICDRPVLPSQSSTSNSTAPPTQPNSC